MIVAQLILFFVRKTHVLEHDGVVHDQTSGCPGSLFAGSPASSSKGYFSLDWQTQTLYLLEKGVKLGLDGVKNSWKLPSSLWYAIAEHDTGALVSIGNETAVFSTTTKKYENGSANVTWISSNENVHKIRKHNGVYYGLDVKNGLDLN